MLLILAVPIERELGRADEVRRRDLERAPPSGPRHRHRALPDVARLEVEVAEELPVEADVDRLRLLDDQRVAERALAVPRVETPDVRAVDVAVRLEAARLREDPVHVTEMPENETGLGQ